MKWEGGGGVGGAKVWPQNIFGHFKLTSEIECEFLKQSWQRNGG